MQLSRELAKRGHEVAHLFSADFQTPKGDLVKRANDPANLCIVGLSLGVPFQKNTFVKRRSQEIAYGQLLGKKIAEIKPDVVISSNTPLDAQRHVLKSARSIKGCKFIFWLQDVYGEAIYRILSDKLGFPGKLIGALYKNMEFSMLRQSDRIVSITEDFVPLLNRQGIESSRIEVIENWAPLNEIAVMPKRNAWSEAEKVADTVNIVYSGTLGFKHNPDLLLRLAKETSANVMVFSEGKVADELAAKGKEQGLKNFRVNPWVKFEILPSVLASADILVALIEPDAGIFSVPSKVLTYTCTNRPVLASIPKDNLAARILTREKAGLVASPDDPDAFVAQAKRLLADPELRSAMGSNGRAYAERQYNIEKLGDRFERLVK